MIQKKSVYLLSLVDRFCLIPDSPQWICAPVYTINDGLSTQIAVGAGLKHDSSIHCDELISLPKSNVDRQFPLEKLFLLEKALKIVPQLHDE